VVYWPPDVSERHTFIREGLMVAVVARLKMQAGKEEQALAQLRQMVEAVQANEPGALAYIAHRSKQDPTQIIFFELYVDDDAFRAHGQTPHMQQFRSAFAEVFEVAETKVDLLDRVAGFIRAEAAS
jgi:quinol monooxygenase YgiN